MNFVLHFLTGKLTQLSKIFQKAADKDVRGIREDKLISLLPRDKVGKFGLSASLEKLECTHHRYLSRGTFMAMFSNESASFIFNMAQNSFDIYFNEMTLISKTSCKLLK